MDQKRLANILFILSIVFGILELIPVVGTFTNILYWMIWIFLMLMYGLEQLKKPKIIIVGALGFLLGLIPFVGGFLSAACTYWNKRIVKADEARKKALNAEIAAQAAQDQEDARIRDEQEAAEYEAARAGQM